MQPIVSRKKEEQNLPVRGQIVAVFLLHTPRYLRAVPV
jgi:hypothetical protein